MRPNIRTGMMAWNRPPLNFTGSRLTPDRPATVSALPLGVTRDRDLSCRTTAPPYRYSRFVKPRVLVIDNYDSFVYILVQYLGELGAEPVVVRNDAMTRTELEALDPAAILISPGPGTPDDAGVSNEVITAFAGRRPVLGVCLGHQCIGQIYGGQVIRAPELMHGKTSIINHTEAGVFAGLPQPLEATRYHSLIVDRASLPDCLEVTAETRSGVIMGLRHRQFDIEGVQFHPESILTVGGKDLLRNFLSRVGSDANRSS
jgi:anthranilate synthase component II